MSDVERQHIQQKIQAEIQSKKEEHLTVYQKGDKAESVHIDLRSTEVPVEEAETKRPKAKKLKSVVSILFCAYFLVSYFAFFRALMKMNLMTLKRQTTLKSGLILRRILKFLRVTLLKQP